jgi:SAM-dependent methyltransferase
LGDYGGEVTAFRISTRAEMPGTECAALNESRYSIIAKLNEVDAQRPINVEALLNLTADYNLAIRVNAERFGVSGAVHPSDHIFNFLFSNPVFHSREAAIEYYFSDGARSAKQFLSLVSQHLTPSAKTPTILEFASGYGCVTRHLALDRFIELCSCDIHPQAIQFLESAIGVHAIQSSSYPEMLQLPMQFDVVFALSFFSHMPITTWSRWLVRLIEATRFGGIIAFTTHGMVSRKYFGEPEIPELGFWFKAESEQADLAVEEYGQTIVTPAFVRKNIASMPFAELIDVREGYWWNHQDLYVLRRSELPKL